MLLRDFRNILWVILKFSVLLMDHDRFKFLKLEL